MERMRVSRDWEAGSYVCFLLWSCFVVFGKFFTFFWSLIHFLRKVIQAGPTNPDCSTPCWKSELWVARPKEGELPVTTLFLLLPHAFTYK